MHGTKTFARIRRTVGLGRVPVLAICAIWISALGAEKYLPPGYGPGQAADSGGFAVDVGYKQVAEDYYLTLKPAFEFGFWDFRVGLQLPLEVLAYDAEPKGEQKVPSIRRGTYDDTSDYAKVIRYVAHGKHLYFNPDDLFNWSFHFGEMHDGYIGHKTIIYRYNSSYDPTVFRAGFMADINNSWGGIEVFQSDAWRNEVIGGRAFIRPIGIAYGVHDLFLAGYSGPGARRQLALSLYDARDPERNGGLLFGESGSIGQQTHKKMRDLKFDENVKFVERKNPQTGKTEVVPVPAGSDPDGGASSKGAGKSGETGPGGKEAGRVGPDGGSARGGRSGDAVTPGGQPGKEPGRVNDPGKGDRKEEKFGRTFWSRWAVGYSVIRDVSAPLILEKDGSSNLVIDPDTSRPRSIDSDTLTFVGMDTEFRLSPVPWMDLTPYVDLNRIKDLPNSEGKHAGIDFGFTIFGNWLKISLRPEYREFSANYIPTYFDSYYAIERTVYIPNGSGSNDGKVTDDSQPKLQYLRGLADDGAITKGYFVELIFNFGSQVIIEGTYEDYDGANNSRVFVGLFVPNLFGSGLYTNGYYTKKGFDQANESFQFDDRSLAAGELGFAFGSLYVQVAFQRSWQYDSTQSAYIANDEKVVSFGFKASK